MNEYTEFDAALIAKIKAGATTFSEIYGGEVGRLALQYPGDDFRAVDRRLQALRKAGKLAYDRKTGWRVL